MNIVKRIINFVFLLSILSIVSCEKNINENECTCNEKTSMNFKFSLTNLRTEETIYISEPVGFDGLNPVFKREDSSHGLYFEFSEQVLSFEGKGREMILSEYDQYGINAKIKFIVELKCNDTWEEFYSGNLEFTTLTIENGNSCFANINVGQQGVQMTFKNRMDTKVDLESLETFDNCVLEKYLNLGKEIEIPAKTINVINKAIMKNDNSRTVLLGMGIGGVRIWYKLPFGENINIEFPGFLNSSMLEYSTNNPDTSSDTEFTIYKHIGTGISIENFRISLSGKIRVERYGGASLLENIAAKIIIRVVKNDGTFKYLVDKQLAINAEPNGIDESFIYSGSVNIDINEYLQGYVEIWKIDYIDPNYVKTTILEGNYIEIEGNSVFYSTNAKTFLIHETLSRVAESITDNQLTVKSDYFGRTDSEINPTIKDGVAGLRCFTNGFMIRRAVFENGEHPKFYASFKDLFDGLKAIDAIGYGIEIEENGSYLRVEPLNYFYNDNIILTCKNVNNVKRTVNNQVLYGVVNIGYQKFESEGFNAIDSFHSQREYRTHLDTDTKFDQLSKLIADSYAIEITRRRQLDASSKDWKYDSDLFIIDLKRDNGIKVNTGTGDPNTLIDPDSVMNVEISPLRNLARWMTWILQGSTPNIGGELIYTSSTGYPYAKTSSNKINTILSGLIKENENLSLSMIQESDFYDKYPKFSPETVTFDYPLTALQFSRIKENPYGLIAYSQYNDDIKYGWIKQLEADIINGISTFTLIAKRITT